VLNAGTNMAQIPDIPVTHRQVISLPVPKGDLQIRFLTPTRLTYSVDFKKRVVHPDSFTFRRFFQRLADRLDYLGKYFSEGGPDWGDFRSLLEAAEKVEVVENRLQQWEDRQTHKLPSDRQGRLLLASSLGFEKVEDFEQTLASHRRQVQRHFDLLLDEGGTKRGHRPTRGGTQGALAGVCNGSTDLDSARALIQELGFRHPDQVLEALDKLRVSPAMKRLGQAGRIKLQRLFIGLYLGDQLVLYDLDAFGKCP